MRSILDPLFRYTSSLETDIRKTFARVRNEKRGDGRSLARKVVVLDRSSPPAQRRRAARS